MKFWLFPLLLLFIGCTTPSTTDDFSVEEDADIDGFILVHSSGREGFVGSNDKSAKTTEQPKMKTEFSYDFSMGRHEVTCGEFRKIMTEELGKKSPIQKCSSDSIPVSDVTFFDAVLYANALGKSQKKDTAYTYSAKEFDSEGHCTSLDNLTYHPKAKAYRLPTEAEWIFAANINWNKDKSWNADNSDFKPHKICKKTSSKSEFCDMAGNVMEWVNDWLDYTKDTTIQNFVGPYEGNTLDERIVKGGSFHTPPSAINTFSRGDVYTVTSTTRYNYIGFRLAFGKIPDPSWLENSGMSTESTIDIMVNSKDIKKTIGTYNAKLVFRNDITGHLTYINFATTKIKVREFNDSVQVYHPVLSPNGEYVAFCTKPEGLSGKSSLYVKSLRFNDYSLVKLDVESAAIPRWYVTSLGDTTIIYVNTSQSNKDESTFKSNSTWQVSFRCGTFGTPKKLFDGAYHGGMSADRKIIVTGAQLLRTKMALGRTRLTNSSRDSIWYNGEQACNVSLSKDSSNRTLFLDFASKTGTAFVGKPYRTHERLFIADSTGKLIQSIGAPSKKTFDHSEWVSPNHAIATLTNANGVHEKIALINIKDSSVTNIIEGDELWHPDMWISPSAYNKSKVNADSAGAYLKPNDTWGSVIMRYKMEILWRFADTANVAIMGSSRPMYSLSPYLLSKDFFAINLGHAPNSIYATRDFINTYVYKQLKKLKYLVISIDLDFWWKIDGKDGDNFFVVNTPNYPGYKYDANHDYWSKGKPQGLLEATENGLGVEEGFMYTTDRGRLLGLPCNSWGDPIIEADSTIYDKNPELIENSFSALESIIKKAADKKIQVVGMILPQNPKYKETGAYGRHGMRRSTAAKLIKRINNLSKEYPNFTLLDENKMGDHDYSKKIAHDSDHLCSEGTYKITAKLDSVLQTLK